MLSFTIDHEIQLKLNNLAHKIAIKHELIKGMSKEEREEIHRFARVSNIGASTRIENAILTDAEIQWIDAVLSSDAHPSSFSKNENAIKDKLSKDRERSIEEVAGCRSMLFLIYEQAKEMFPLTQSSLRGLHQQLLQFYPPAHYYLGQYKTVPNSVIEKNERTGAQRFVFKTADPGPTTEVAMNELVSWYNETLPKNPWTIAVACEFVFRFLAIHPFQDGNGRVGRGLFLLTLLQTHEEPLSGLARYIALDRQIERHRQEYYEVLQRCSGGVFHSDPKECKIEIFLRYMIKMMNFALEDIDVYQKKYEATQRLPDSALKVLDCMREFPEKRLQTREILEATGIPRRTIIHALNQLVKAQLIRKYGQGRAVRYQMIF